MRYSFYDNPLYRAKQSAITKSIRNTEKYKRLITPLVQRECMNESCNNTFKVKPWDPRIYCSHSCSAIVNNHRRPKKVSYCTYCNQPTKRYGYKYCSLKCQHNDFHHYSIKCWKAGKINGNIGIKTRTLAKYLKRYLLEKYNHSCSICGWSIYHPITKRVPLEVNHIDGNAENNSEDNLNLLCPNCHSLTPNFRNLNKGKGRVWRLKK